MKRAVILVTVLGLGLSACGFGQSRLNPFNWFGGARTGTPEALYQVPVDPRGLVDTIITLKVEPYPGGAILRATGVPQTQGFWDASLEPVSDDGTGKKVPAGRLVFEFRITPPIKAAPAGTQPSREVTVATNLSDYKLAGISAIEVRGATNAMTAHR